MSVRKKILIYLSGLLASQPYLSGDWLSRGTAEILTNSDITLVSGWVALEKELNETWTLSGRFDHNRLEVDYTPTALIDPFGISESISESLYGAQIAADLLNDRFLHSFSLNAYDGFRDYNSIWLDRYYRQQYAAGGIPGVSYENPDPKGFGVTTSHRFEIIKNAGYLTLSLSYLNDEVAPGYEVEDLESSFELISSNDRLHTWSGSIEWEGVINKRARGRTSLTVLQTTSRDTRLNWSGAINFMLTEDLIIKSEASFATENPDFEAWSIAPSIHYTLNESWSVGLSYRYYEDTGQIESANLISTAAPELTTRQFSLSLRYTAEDGESGFSISIGPYYTRFGETGIGTDRFRNLYTNRDWFWSRIAFNKSF